MAQKLYVLFWHFSRTALGFARTVHYSHSLVPCVRHLKRDRLATRLVFHTRCA